MSQSKLTIKNLEEIQSKEQIDPGDCYYLYSESSLFIKSKITNVTCFEDDFGDLDYIMVHFENGFVRLQGDYPIVSLKESSHLMKQFDWGVTIRNHKFEHMGYIAKPKSV